MRDSRPGMVMPPPDPTVAPVRSAVRAASDVAGVDRLHAALYHLAVSGDARLRPVVLLRHLDGRIDVQLFSVREPIPPWTATDNRFWTLAPDAKLPEVDPLVMPCPALVQVGVCDDDGAELYLDLEGAGLLALNGNPETVRQVARALTATLVVSPTARLCRVLTLGFDPYGLDEHVEDRFVVAKSMESLLHEAEMTAKDVVAGIAERDAGSSFRLRALDSDAGWEPSIVVIAGVPLAPDEVARLEALAGDGGRGAAVVSTGIDKALWSLDLVDAVGGQWELNPLGLRVRPVQLAADELRELAAYLDDAATAPVETLADAAAEGFADPFPVAPLGSDIDGLGSRAPASPGPAVAGDGQPLTAQALAAEPVYVEPDWSVMIRLFGPPGAVNRKGLVAGDAGRGAPLEMLAWLVTHRDTATRSGAKFALWGGEDVSPRTLTNALNGARIVLRDLADEPAEEFIARRSERLALHPTVTSDYDLVCDRLAFARRYAERYPSAAAAALAGGLNLVRGEPLAGVKWLWADESPLYHNMGMAGSALATRLAELRLEAGQTDAVIDAATAGERVIPGNNKLVRLRMQACIDSGDRRGALVVYEKYAAAAAQRGDSIAPEIADLRNDLLRTGRR